MAGKEGKAETRVRATGKGRCTHEHQDIWPCIAVLPWMYWVSPNSGVRQKIAPLFLALVSQGPRAVTPTAFRILKPLERDKGRSLLRREALTLSNWLEKVNLASWAFSRCIYSLLICHFQQTKVVLFLPFGGKPNFSNFQLILLLLRITF